MHNIRMLSEFDQAKINIELCNICKRLLQSKGLTYSRAAELLGMNPGTLWNQLNGRVNHLPASTVVGISLITCDVEPIDRMALYVNHKACKIQYLPQRKKDDDDSTRSLVLDVVRNITGITKEKQRVPRNKLVDWTICRLYGLKREEM